MPYAHISTNVEMTPEKKTTVLQACSQIISAKLGKPEAYVMVALNYADMVMAGEPSPAAFIDLRSLGGLNPTKNRALSAELCAIMGRELNVDAQRVYINFTDMARPNWGWNNATF